jgi:signal peptidase I
MFDKWMQYSYVAQKHQRTKVYKLVFIVLILYVVYNCFVSFFFSVWVIDNDTMRPGISSGDRLLFTSFTLPSLINRVKKVEYTLPFSRGSIVLVDMRHAEDINPGLRVVDGIVRFFTAQKISVITGGQYYVKRVIALPGDEISMSNYVFRVKVKGSPYNLTEFELSGKPYHPEIPQAPQLWDESIPFSGSMDAVVLGADECFVVSDDRGNTNDSRTWGAISPSLIKARALLRFWPVMKIELF